MEAMEILGNLPTKSIMEVKRKVERYVQDKGDREVWASAVYAAKIDIKILFPIPSNTQFERHMGLVTGMS